MDTIRPREPLDKAPRRSHSVLFCWDDACELDHDPLCHGCGDPMPGAAARPDGFYSVELCLECYAVAEAK